MTADEIRAAFELAHPGAAFDELTFELIAMEERRERREYFGPSLAERIDALSKQVGTLLRRRPPELAAPVSLVEAARVLGVSKTRTLLPAIRRGDVRVVRVGGRLRVPVDELERIEVEGLNRQKRRRPRASSDATPTSPARDLQAEVAEVRGLRFPNGHDGD
ncbi:MAG TPA: hypothetical protein VII08_10865 [Myxococcales bacterium]